MQARLAELLQLADEIGLSVRRVPLGGDGGGYCQIKGQRVLFVDTMADMNTQYEKTLTALAPLKELDERFLKPAVREDIDRQRAEG